MTDMLRFIAPLAALALATSACSSDGGATDGGGTGGTAGAGAGGAPSFPFETGDTGSCGRTVRPLFDDACQAAGCQIAEPDCAVSAVRPIEACCVQTAVPGQSDPPTISRSTDTKEFSGTGDVDLSCMENPPSPPGTSRNVTMQGVVKSFANGCDLVGVKVEVFRVNRTGDRETDGELGDLVGSAVITDDMSEAETEEVSTCPMDRSNRRYEYDMIPTETELVILTSGATASDLWRPLYTYNVYVANDDPDLSGDIYTRDLRALAEDDYGTIPTVAIGRTLTAGRGALGGEVHDCGNVRVQNAIVDVSDSGRVSLKYFNADEDDPLPDPTRDTIGTGRTALYSAFDLRPGWVRVSAVGLIPGSDGNRLVSLGYADARVFADSVTSVSLRGTRPYQVQ